MRVQYNTTSGFADADRLAQGMDPWDLKNSGGFCGYPSLPLLRYWASAEALFSMGGGRNPRTTELACKELTRMWAQRDEFGPVTHTYADDPCWYRPEAFGGSAAMQAA